MKNKNIGKVQIDLLKLTFWAEDEIINMLSEYNKRWEFGGAKRFYLDRVADNNYENVYTIEYLNTENKPQVFGKLKFNLHCSTTKWYKTNIEDGKKKVWISIDNRVFYTDGDLLFLKMIIEELKLSFLHFSTIDVCVDKTFDVYKRIRQNIRNKKLDVLVNGRKVDKNKHLIEAEMRTSGSLLKPLEVKSYYIKQKKAQKDKSKGNYIVMYDKKTEIINASEKYYILDYYGTPDILHRLEVHICQEKIKNYMEGNNIVFSVESLTNQSFLKELYDYFLSSILRFRTKHRTKVGRKIKNWNVLLR